MNYLEHNRGEPPDYLRGQFADVLRMERDVLYFWTRRMLPDIETGQASPQQVTAAYPCFPPRTQGQAQ